MPDNTPDAANMEVSSGAGAAANSPDGSAALEARLPASNVSTYARGLLRITVPLRVTLASQRKSMQEIIELGPGSIVKFNKTCEEPLELTVGDRPIARGSVVKVGDKFGLRISTFLGPQSPNA
jgi:flagellar motor switch protein FliN